MIRQPFGSQLFKSEDSESGAAGGSDLEHHLVAISAAIAFIFGKRARIRRIAAVTRPVVSPWAQQGRIIIQASHNLK